jgi:hypothetical protein
MYMASIQGEVVLSFANPHFDRCSVVEPGAILPFFSECKDEFCEYRHVRVSFFCIERTSVWLHKPLLASLLVN